MKMRTIFGYSLLVGMLLVSASCSKFLEEEPKNSTFVSEFWQSSGDVNSGLAGAYALLRAAITSGNGGAGRHFMYGDGIAGHYFTIQYTGDGLEGIQTGDFTFQYNIESFGDWTQYYKVITMSNLLLERVSEMDESLLNDQDNPAEFVNDVMGQAYFIRALAYFFLTRTWGDVPLVLNTSNDPINEEFLGRSPKSEIMAQIEMDCFAAAELLDWGYTDVTKAKVTANKGSVYALLAHLYLWRATTTDVTSDMPIMDDVDKAQDAITQLKNSGGYRLVDTASYYSTFVGQSSDGIFELAASEKNLEGSNSHIGMFFLRQANISYNSATYSRFYVNPTYLSTHFSKEYWGWGWVWSDTANEWQWIDHAASVGETVYNDEYPDGIVVTAAMLIDGSDVRYRRNFTDLSLDQPTCIKYHEVNYRSTNSAYLGNNLIIFRYSDMLLLEAEIALYKNQVADAVGIINAFRTRNGSNAVLSTDITKDEAMYEYMIERGKELYLEGHLFYDLLRTRQYPQFITWLSDSRFRQQGFYWPAAPALFMNNLNMTQTSYWVGRI
ncbi:RagB/SusD family nutrient uptake outer membrane protein [Parapedobacter sp. DT-150]|uniref:RagB/SusD family nutrient uptake outer membrane protein n=1 Tax=Parapedobacter sp. DT-150 TaxID=3396162 RepID=UPI003F1CC13C